LNVLALLVGRLAVVFPSFWNRKIERALLFSILDNDAHFSVSALSRRIATYSLFYSFFPFFPFFFYNIRVFLRLILTCGTACMGNLALYAAGHGEEERVE
jgi:hypothetical protein